MFSRSLLRPTSLVSRRLGAATYSAAAATRSSHTPDSYSKEVDSSPATDSSIHRVDPSSENVQKPHEPPSGPWSATGVDAGVKHAQGKGKTGTDEYRTMDAADRPYAAPGERDRYGGMQGDKQKSSDKTSQGPQGSDSAGRMPEGR